MKYHLPTYSYIVPALLALVVWIISHNSSITTAVFIVLLLPAIIKVYVPYAKENPKQLWFKRKLYGWGWTPVTWQGWVATLVYALIVIAFSFTINNDSPIREVVFTFALPIIVLTIAFMRLCYKKGERPHWSWGRDDRNL